MLTVSKAFHRPNHEYFDRGNQIAEGISLCLVIRYSTRLGRHWMCDIRVFLSLRVLTLMHTRWVEFCFSWWLNITIGHCKLINKLCSCHVGCFWAGFTFMFSNRRSMDKGNTFSLSPWHGSVVIHAHNKKHNDRPLLWLVFFKNLHSIFSANPTKFERQN